MSDETCKDCGENNHRFGMVVAHWCAALAASSHLDRGSER